MWNLLHGNDQMIKPAAIPLSVERRILLLRGCKVLLSGDLAELYGIEAKALIQAVKRNLNRFPEDFMFQLAKEEADSLRSQIVTLKRGQHSKYLPYAFTEQGVAMLSSVLNSPRAVAVNIEIMRAFVKLRLFLATNEELARKLAGLEKKYDQRFKAVFDAIREMMKPSPRNRRRIGFRGKDGSNDQSGTD